MRETEIREDVRVRFGNAVRRRREELGLSQEELAEEAGLHRTYVGDIERGVRNPSLLSIQKLAAGLMMRVCTCDVLELCRVNNTTEFSHRRSTRN